MFINVEKRNTTSQSNIKYSNEIFKQYLMQLSTGLIWKDSTLANSLEPDTVNDLYLSELFITANRGLLNFDVVKSFPRVVLRNAGVSEVDVEIFATDKDKIPQSMRSIIVDEYTKALTSKNPITAHYEYYDNISKKYITLYDEKNNYYRMLMGFPDINDKNFIYNRDSRWDTNTPIHLMSYVDRIEMENEGILDQLYSQYPDKKYILYLGKRNQDFFSARIADRFEILYKNDSVSDVLNKDFVDTYNKCRYMVKNVYYNLSFTKTNQLYDNFMAMCILFMTIQQMQHKYLEVDITRDFYDVESLKLVYDSYSVPFYSEIPLDYHRRIVKNINRLISYKGSSEVFFDLFNIFDLGSMDIYQYFLTKTHKIDSDGKPSFIPLLDEDDQKQYDNEGNLILDPSNYTLQFSKVKINEDPALAVSDKANDIDYEYLTVPDPYWIEDRQLQEKLKNESFNYLETKYIGIQTIFDLMKITYENAYIFRIITDNKELTETFNFRWTDIGISCSIFDIFIYLASIYCRYYSYEGLISNWIPAVMDTIGYDYEKASSIITRASESSRYIQSNKRLIELITQTKLTNLDSVNMNYDNIMEIQSLIIRGYTDAKSIDEFNAYRDLFNALLTSREITSVYTDPATGEIFESFTDVLAYSSPDLMQRYLLLDDNSLQDEMTIVINQVEKLITSMRYLPFSAGVSSSAMIESLFKILTFFKSAKTELIGYEITYKLTMRGINFFKMMGDITSSFEEIHGNDDINLEDFIQAVDDIIKCGKDAIELQMECIDMTEKTKLQDYISSLMDTLTLLAWEVHHVFKDDGYVIDILHKINDSNILFEDDIKNKDTIFKIYEIIHGSHLTKLSHQLIELYDVLIDNNDSDTAVIIEKIQSINKIHQVIDKIFIKNNEFRFDLKITDLLYIKLMTEFLAFDVSHIKDSFKGEIEHTLYKNSHKIIDRIISLNKDDDPNDANIVNENISLIERMIEYLLGSIILININTGKFDEMQINEKFNVKSLITKLDTEFNKMIDRFTFNFKSPIPNINLELDSNTSIDILNTIQLITSLRNYKNDLIHDSESHTDSLYEYNPLTHIKNKVV